MEGHHANWVSTTSAVMQDSCPHTCSLHCRVQTRGVQNCTFQLMNSDAVLFPCNCKVKAPPETHHLPAQDSLSASCCTHMLRRCFLYGIPHGTMTANQSCQWQKLSHNRKALITCVRVPWAWYSSHGIPCCPLLSTTTSLCHLQNMTATDTSGDEKLEGKDEGEEKQEPVEVTKKHVQNSRFLCTAGHRSVLYPRSNATAN